MTKALRASMARGCSLNAGGVISEITRPLWSVTLAISLHAPDDELRDTLVEQLGKERQMAGEALSRDLLEHPPVLPGEPPCGE